MAKEYIQVPSNDDLSIDEEPIARSQPHPRDFFARYGGLIGSICFLLLFPSMLLNAVLIAQKDRAVVPRVIHPTYSYSHITQDTPIVFRSTSDYWGENDTLADELWESINIDPITVALSSEYVEQHGLADSSRFPWDNDKRTYILKGFHDLHCLKSMRRAFVDLQRGVDTKTDWFHMYHCLDALRQDLMCYADDTPMPIPADITYIGDGQVRQCRDWNKLTAWAMAPEQNACYRQLSDYNQVFHSLEKFAFCPEGSPYYDIQREYFEKHGHVDPFVQ